MSISGLQYKFVLLNKLLCLRRPLFMENNQKMNGFQIIGYGLGSFGKDFALGVIGSYLLVFYTNVFGISAAVAGTIFFVAKIWDAVLDPAVGALADRSPVTRWGRYRPYILFTALPLSIFSFLCFLAPDFSPTGKVAYAIITYMITGTIFTVYDVPLWSMIPSLTNDNHTKNKLIGAARAFTTIAMMLASAVAYDMIQKLGGGSEVANLKSGYPKFMFIVGVLSVVFAVISFFSTKEVNIAQVPAQKSNIFKDFISVMCKPLVLVLIGMVCCAFVMILPSTVGVYYMIYYLGKPALIASYMTVCMGAGIITTVITPAILKRIAANHLTMIAFFLEFVSSVAIYFIGKGNINVLFVCFAVIGMAVGTQMVSITTMVAQTSNYIAELKGHRADGVCFSMNAFAIKVGQAVTGALVGFLLAASGYVANSKQSASALNGILFSRSLLPAIVAVAGLLFIALWKIPKENQ